MKLTSCTWSVWNRFAPTRHCGRKTVDGQHCAQHAKMAARNDAASADALASFRAALAQADGGGE